MSSSKRGGDRWLTREEQAELLGVDVATIAKYHSVRFGPDSATPFPTHVEGQHRPGRHSRAAPEVLESALREWKATRDGMMGRPRTRAPGLTIPQHRALAEVDEGRDVAARMLVSLIRSGHVSHPAGGAPRLTVKGRRVLEEYPLTPQEQP